MTGKYVEWAMENGAPVPNVDLYKKYRDEYSMNPRWDCYHDWHDSLGITRPTKQVSSIWVVAESVAVVAKTTCLG